MVSAVTGERSHGVVGACEEARDLLEPEIGVAARAFQGHGPAGQCRVQDAGALGALRLLAGDREDAGVRPSAIVADVDPNRAEATQGGEDVFHAEAGHAELLDCGDDVGPAKELIQ